jgi:NADPH:quinone reductase-like Zn-dependent oxidoreductase
MVCMGVFGHIETLGIESTGIVREVGQNVKHIKPGDRVAVVSSGIMQSQAVIPAVSCMKIPDDLSLDDAATMVVAFSTVLYSLNHIGRLEKGQVSRTYRYKVYC